MLVAILHQVVLTVMCTLILAQLMSYLPPTAVAVDLALGNQYVHWHQQRHLPPTVTGMRADYMQRALNPPLPPPASIASSAEVNANAEGGHDRGVAPAGPISALPPELFDPVATPLIFLNVGGVLPVENWYNVNAQYDDTYHTNSRDGRGYILRSAENLHGFHNGSVSIVYSSHTLEHTSMATGETLRTLREWRRVLRYGGLLMLAVPDMQMLSRLFLEPSYPDAVHFALVSMMMGGHRDQYDYHASGFDFDILSRLLAEAGFCSVERVNAFNVFPPDHDSSTFQFMFLHISLNVLARPCVPDGVTTDGFEVTVDAEPYVSDLDNIAFIQGAEVVYPRQQREKQRKEGDGVALGGN